MYQFVIVVLLKLAVKRKRFGVSAGAIISRSDNNNVISSVAVDVLVKCISIVEIAEQQSEIPVSHHARIQQKLRRYLLIWFEKLQRNKSVFA